MARGTMGRCIHPEICGIRSVFFFNTRALGVRLFFITVSPERVNNELAP